MSEQGGKQVATLQRPITDDPQVWKTYWITQGQPWRTEPEIDTERQKYLKERRAIVPNIKKGIYPFKDIKLSRADVEWLLATHENGHGPVDWDDKSKRNRPGLDLRGTDLRHVDLHHLPLACLRGGINRSTWDETTLEQRILSEIKLERASLRCAHLEAACLARAHLERADIGRAHLEGADLYRAHLEGATLFKAYLGGASLRNAYLDTVTNLSNILFEDENSGITLTADIHWSDVNLAVVNWSQVKVLGDEHKAHQTKEVGDYRTALRANRQLAVALQAQGLKEDAARFAYRAQKLQRVVLRRQHRFGQYLFSLLLDVFAGYGYKPERCFFVYVLALAGFTVAHYIVGIIAGPHLSWLSALAVSIQSLHGRIFSFQPGDPQTLLNTIEAFVGLFIEAIVVAIITQRILGK